MRERERERERENRKCVSGFMWSAFCSFPVWMNFLDRFSENTQISDCENPSSRSRVVPCGRTDGHDDANSHFSQFCKRDYKLFLGINISIRCLPKARLCLNLLIRIFKVSCLHYIALGLLYQSWKTFWKRVTDNVMLILVCYVDVSMLCWC